MPMVDGRLGCAWEIEDVVTRGQSAVMESVLRAGRVEEDYL